MEIRKGDGSINSPQVVTNKKRKVLLDCELGSNSRKLFSRGKKSKQVTFSTCTWQEYRQPTFHSKETPALAIYPLRRTLSSRPCYDGGDEEGEGANIGAQLRNPRQRKALRNDWWEEQVLEFSTLVKILPNHGDNLVVRLV